MVKKVLANVMRTVMTPPRALQKTLNFEGAFQTKVEGDKFGVYNNGYPDEVELFWKGINGISDKISMSLWRKLVQNTFVVFDTNANYGLYALIAKTLNPRVKMAAFEPFPPTFQRLKDNDELNQFRMMCINGQVGDVGGATIEMRTTPGADPNPKVDPFKKYTCETFRLDKFIEDNKVKKLDLLKTTNTVKVLIGLGECLDKMRPPILMEVLTDEDAQTIEGMLDGKEYIYFNVDESGPVKRITKMVKSTSRNLLVCSKPMAAQLRIL